MNKIKRYLPYIAGITVSIIFGMSFMFTKSALDVYMPMQLLGYRFFVAASVLTILSFFKIVKLDYKGKPVKKLLLLSFFQPLAYFVFETIGVKMTSSSEAGIMIALIPVIVIIMAVIFLGERPSTLQLIFSILSVAGVIFIVMMSGQIKLSGHILGLLALLGAVISGGIFNIMSRDLSNKFSPVEITHVMMSVGAVVFNAAAIIQFWKLGKLGEYVGGLFNPTGFGAIFYLGFISSIGAFFLLNYTLSKMPASRSVVFSNLTTVISIIAGVTIRHEPFNLYQLFGAFMIIAGVWGANYFAKESDTEEKACEA